MYTVKKHKGVWVIDADGVAISFDDYLSAIETAQSAADVFRRAGARLNQPVPRVDIEKRASLPHSRQDAPKSSIRSDRRHPN